MTSDKNRHLLEILSKFTYYGVEDLEIGYDTLKFKYISWVKDIICECELNNKYCKFNIYNAEWVSSIKDEDVLRELSRIEKVKDYINSIDKKGIVISNDNISTNVKFIHTKLNLNLLEKDIEIVDRILLNIFLILNNEELIGLNKKVCVYPSVRLKKKILYRRILVNEGYTKYWGSIIDGDLSDTLYEFGCDLSTLDKCIDNECEGIKKLDYKVDILDCIVLNKNLITLLNILEEVRLGNGITLILDVYNVRLVSDTPINIGYAYYNNFFGDGMIFKRHNKCVFDIGKLVGNTLLLRRELNIDTLNNVIVLYK